MLRDELEFRIRMRNCLKGIQHLDPETIAARLIEFDREIDALQARIEKEGRPSRIEVVPVGARVKAA